METVYYYESPLGRICLAAENEALTGLWFEGQKYYRRGHESAQESGITPVLREACEWLDAYFAKRNLPKMPELAPKGTEFQRRVWAELERIPYGETVSYGDIAAAVGCSGARAVGAAVGRNPISIMIPCHRVVGGNGALTGYAGGVERKIRLLELEERK